MSYLTFYLFANKIEKKIESFNKRKMEKENYVMLCMVAAKAALGSTTMIECVKSVAIKLSLCVLLHLGAHLKPSLCTMGPTPHPHIPVTSAYQDFQPHRPLLSLHVFNDDVTAHFSTCSKASTLFIINPASLLRSPRRLFVFVQVSITLLP